MKVIDLLVAISKDEKTPVQFELGGMKYHKDMFGRYKDEDGVCLYDGLDTTFMDLNNEIEIIEEDTNKIINIYWKIGKETINPFIDTQDSKITALIKRTEHLKETLNEIINYINKEK